MKRHLWFAVIASLGAAVDLLSKHLVFAHQHSWHRDLVIIPGFFEFGCTTNKGIVFGFAPDASKVFLWVSIIAVPAIIAIYWSLKKPSWVMTASLALILGGTIGNMYDRIADGAVRDFIKFYYPGLIDAVFHGGPVKWKPWPLFNLADSCICVGVALLSFEMLFFDDKRKKKEPEPAPEAASVTNAPPPVEANIETKTDAPKPEEPGPQGPPAPGA